MVGNSFLFPLDNHLKINKPITKNFYNLKILIITVFPLALDLSHFWPKKSSLIQHKVMDF